MLAAPGHALTIVQFVIVTVAVSAGVHALTANVPPTGWMSPLKWMSPFNRALHGVGGTPRQSDELRTIRSRMGGWRRRIHAGVALPEPTLRMVRPLITAALDLDLGEGRQEDARGRVSRSTWAILESDPNELPRWYLPLPPDAHSVANVVNEVLDDLEGLHRAAATREPTPHSGWTRST